MQKRKIDRPDNLQAVSLEPDEQTLAFDDDDGHRDYVEADLAEKADEMLRELFRGDLSPEVLKAAFRVTVVKKG